MTAHYRGLRRGAQGQAGRRAARWARIRPATRPGVHATA